MIFDEGVGSGNGSFSPDTSHFEWLSRCDRPQAAVDRRIINRWVEEFPSEGREGLAHRLRSDSRRTFLDALFELYLFILLSRQGFEVRPEPRLSTGSRPDFLVTVDGVSLCYLEATVNHGVSQAIGFSERVDRLLHALNPRVRVVGYAIWLHEARCGETNPSPKRLAAAVNDWVRRATQIVHPAHGGSSSNVGKRELIEDPASGWGLRCSLVPLRDPTMVADPPFGGNSSSPMTYIPDDLLREEVRDKLRQHAGADLPLVVAVSFSDYGTGPDEGGLIASLIGTAAYSFPRHDASTGQWIRHENGLWTAEGRSAVSRCPAVITCGACFPTELGQAQPILWHNPRNELEQLRAQWRCAQRRWRMPSGTFESVPGDPANVVLRLDTH